MPNYRGGEETPENQKPENENKNETGTRNATAASVGGRLKRRKSRKSRKPRKSRKQRKSHRRR